MFTYHAEIIRIIDGDTIKVRIDLGFHTHRIENIRILDYDAPETRLYKGVTQEEKKLGIKARIYAKLLLPPGKEITVNTHYDKTGKYGRFLANVLFEYNGDVIDYAEHMKSKGFIKK